MLIANVSHRFENGHVSEQAIRGDNHSEILEAIDLILYDWGVGTRYSMDTTVIKIMTDQVNGHA